MRFTFLHFSQLLGVLLLASLSTGCSNKAKEGKFSENGKKFFEAGEFEKSKIEYLNVLKLDPKNAGAIARLGLIWMEQGVPLRAIPYLIEARRLNPGDIPVRIQLMTAFGVLGGIKEAREEATALLGLAPDNSEALVTLAESSRSQEEIDFSRQKVKQFPNQNSAAVHLATALIALRERDANAAKIQKLNSPSAAADPAQKAKIEAALSAAKEEAEKALSTAETEVEQALTLEPGSARGLTLSAGLLFNRNSPAEAEAKLKTLSESVPARSPYRLKYAEVKAKGKTEESLAAAQSLTAEILKQAPDFLPALTLSAQLSFTRKNPAEAMATLEKVFAIDSENSEARLLQAKGWMVNGEAAKAVESLDKLVENLPGHFMAKFQLALACVQTGNPSKAGRLLSEILKIQPGFADAILLQAELNVRGGKPAEVIAPLNALLNNRPGNTTAAHLLAEAYQAMNRTDDAIKIIESLIRTTPQDSRHQFRLGEILRAAKRTADARQVFEQILSSAPGSLAVVTQLVELDLDEKQTDSARYRINEFLGKFPDSPGAYVVKAQIHAAAKEWAEAETALLKSIELKGSNPEAYRFLAAVFTETGKAPEAIAKLETLLQKSPGDVQALRQMAALHDKQGDYVNAGKAFDKLLSVLPEPDPVILNDYACLLMERLNQPDKALDLARKARGLRPGTELSTDTGEKAQAAAIADTLGWALFKKGEFKEALAVAREAGAYFKDLPEVQFHLAESAWAMGEVSEARTALEKVAASSFSAKTQAQSKLAILGESGKGVPPRPIKEIQEMLTTQPGDPILQTMLAEALEAQKDHKGAAAAYEQVLARNPALLPVSIKLAQLYAGPLNDLKKAAESAGAARQASPSDPRVAGILGEISYKSGDFTKAYNLLRESATELSSDPSVLFNLGLASYAVGLVPSAREAMQKVLTTAPQSPSAIAAKQFLQLTGALENPATLTAAGPAAEALLATDPANVPALMVRAALESTKSSTEAAAIYQAILKRLPDFAPAQKQLAILYVNDPQKREEGYSLAVKAREKLENDADLAQAFAVLNYYRKDYSSAVRLLRECAQKAPLDSRGLFYLGMSLKHANDNPGCKEALTGALAAGLPEPMASEAKAALASLN